MSFRRRQLGSHWTNFHEMLYLSIFRKSVEKIQVSIKSDKNNGRALYIKTCVHLWRYLAQSFLEWEMFQTKVVEKIKPHVLCSITPPPSPRKECCLWDNVEKYCRAGQATDGNIIRRMRIACWIPKATNAHSEYEIRIAFQQQQWLHERASMLCYNTLPVLFMCPSSIQ
jgi:hypothetical protein